MILKGIEILCFADIMLFPWPQKNTLAILISVSPLIELRYDTFFELRMVCYGEFCSGLLAAKEKLITTKGFKNWQNQLHTYSKFKLSSELNELWRMCKP